MRWLKSLCRPPAVQALLVQCAALVLLSLLLSLNHALGGRPLPLLAALFAQGALAAALTWWRGLDTWWLPIQLLFPLAIVGTRALDLPPVVFLVSFVVLLGLFWSTFRTRVPYFPSRLHTWQQVEALLPKDRAIRFIDIGSGFGGLAMHLSRARPESDCRGIEIAPLPWLVSAIRARLRGRAGQFLRGDYEGLDFSDFDVVFAYLSPAAMPALWEKARREMRAGSLLLSYEFKIPGITPEITTEADSRNATIYGWQL